MAPLIQPRGAVHHRQALPVGVLASAWVEYFRPPRSSSGLGHLPFTPATRVRIPYGVQQKPPAIMVGGFLFCGGAVKACVRVCATARARGEGPTPARLPRADFASVLKERR